MKMMKTTLFICTLVLAKAVDYDYVSKHKCVLITLGVGIVIYEVFIQRKK